MNSYLDIVRFVFEIISTIVMIYLTFIVTKFTAKPKLKIRFKNGKKEAEFGAGKKATLKLYVENQGHWYAAKPAARKTALYVNFPPIFEPIEIRYGSNLEKSNRKVKIGKGGRKYLKTEEIIYLFYEEPGEEIEIDVKMPQIEGRYPIEIAAYSEEGSCGFQRLWLKVVKKSDP